jgi:hypothetical protein
VPGWRTFNSFISTCVISRLRILTTCLFFFLWFVTDNVRMYINSVHGPWIYEFVVYSHFLASLCNFGILDLFGVLHHWPSPRWYISKDNHGEMISTGENWFIEKSSLTILPKVSSGSMQEERGNVIMNLALRSIFVHTCKWYFTCRKMLRHGPPVLRHFRSKTCWRFSCPLKIHYLGRDKPKNFGFNGRHANHYTTDMTDLHNTVGQYCIS